MSKYNVGDIVQLKSGGPLMTIYSVPNTEMGEHDYGCTWFNGKKVEHSGFQEEVLKEPEKK